MRVAKAESLSVGAASEKLPKVRAVKIEKSLKFMFTSLTLKKLLSEVPEIILLALRAFNDIFIIVTYGY